MGSDRPEAGRDRDGCVSDPPIRDASTIIVVRDRHAEPRVLMGQRGARAAFMPNKFVFPGGAVDADDAKVPLSGTVAPRLSQTLSESSRALPSALLAGAVRELWEETGLILGARRPWPDPPADWRAFAAAGYQPSAEGLEFIFRAITPPGRPRRFDARFFVTDAEHLAGDPDDFSNASDELANLTWIGLEEARALDLPFITRIVLAEVVGRLPSLAPPSTVPFFASDEEERMVRHLGLKSWDP
jgi:8-oxo-dGTP pyrophosphatase MutT (NUDIX family)